MKSFKLSILFLLFLGVSQLFAAGQKIAYIDTQIIFGQSRDMVAANEALENERKNWETQLKEIETNLEALKVEFNTKKLLLSQEGLEEAKKEIQDLEADRSSFLDRVFGTNGEAVQRNNELLAPIITKINKAIEKVALDKDIDMVLDSNSTGIMYAKPSLDITDEVLEAMEDETISTESEEETDNKK